MSNTRLERGQEIADKPNQVVRINEKSYIVKSQTTDSEYEILESEMVGYVHVQTICIGELLANISTV